MSISIAKLKYQLVVYVSIREAARLSGIAEHTLSKAVYDQLIGGINLPEGEFFVRWEDCSSTFSSSAMAHGANVTPFAEPAARNLNYENSVRSNDAPHVGGRYGDTL